MKVNDSINNARMQNIKPKLKNISNKIVENKKAVKAFGVLAGLTGLAIYAAATIKPTEANFDIYNNYMKKEVVQQPAETSPYEENIKNIKTELNSTKTALSKDLTEQKNLENVLQIQELYDKEYFQQQHDVLNDFIKMNEDKIAKLTKELEFAENAYKQTLKGF